MRSRKKHRTPSHGWGRALAVWGLVLLAPPAPTAETPSEEPAVEVTAKDGLRAYLDPETGELTSTPSREQVDALSKKLEPALERSSAGLEPFGLERGGRGVFLQGRFQSALVVRQIADGTFELVCTNDPEHAAHAEPPAATQQWVEK